MQNANVSESTQIVPQNRTTFLDLNDDVLTMIVSDFTTKDSLQLSLVARRIHLLAKHQALSSVTMKSMQAVMRICTYMLGDVIGRLQWIRRLSVSVGLPYQGSGIFTQHDYPQKLEEALTALGLLTSLFKHASGLRHLHIAPLEDLLVFHPPLLDAIYAHANLAELELLQCDGCETIKLLDGLRSQPQSLMLEVRTQDADKDAIISRIGRFHELRALSLYGLYTPHYPVRMDTEHFMRNLHHSWPKVTDLTLGRCEIQLPAVLCAFPNLRTLTFTEWGSPHTAAPDRPTYSVPLQGTSGLEYVEGSGHLLENWPTARPVYHILIQSILAIPSLSVMGGLTRSGDPEIPIVLQMVRNAEPIVFTFRIMAFESLLDSFWRSLAREATRLRCLEVELCLFRETKGLTSLFLDWMTNVPSTLSPMASLSYLEIAINGDLSQFITCVVSEAAEPVDLDNSQEYAERLASLVIAQVPSLRYISLGFGHPFAGMMWMWKVEHGGGERTLSPIPPNIAQRLRVVLKSPNYHPQRESEGEPSLPLRAHGSVDIIDAPYSHGMRLVSMAGKCSKFHLPPQ
ncbi:hypothetical protein IEO21_08607 [Rhodonia placenta]|uniref:F-box domain-containing protein n=1 Tax=Rhodonia placenta TaxID=104341 RepID=A0A8H7NW45_9APHY|nr:hypothetical protein IEO21_08607 [Postia placenta]